MLLVPGGGAAGLARRTAARVLRRYGRVVIAIADRVAPGPHAATHGAARSDARTADVTHLRRLALDSTLTASLDPTRTAHERLVTRTTSLSDWAAGRLLGEAERMRQAAVTAYATGADDAHPPARRQVDAMLRRQFPWLDEDAATRLYDHAVLTASRFAEAEQAPGPAEGVRGFFGRLRRRA